MPPDAPADASREGALAVVEAERGVLAVGGADRVRWLNGVVTCDVPGVSPGRAGFGLLLTKQGKIRTDFYLVAEPTRLLLATAPGTLAETAEELDRMLVMEDAELADASADLVCVTLHGPKGMDIAGRAGLEPSELDRTGLGGAVALVPRGELDEALGRLAAEGAVLATGDEWSRVRIERAVAEFGADYGPADSPHQASLERLAVDWKKGCYLGQEAVFMQDARGRVKRRLVLLSTEGGSPPAPGEPVTRPSGEKVGQVTSGALGRSAAKPVALAAISAPDFEAGTSLVVAGAAARVEPRPL